MSELFSRPVPQAPRYAPLIVVAVGLAATAVCATAVNAVSPQRQPGAVTSVPTTSFLSQLASS